MTKKRLRPAVAPKVATKDKARKPPQAAVKAVPCPPCDGTGKLKVRQEVFAGSGEMNHVEVQVKCGQCGGSGKWYVDKD